MAAAGSLLVGVLESFSSFWASAYKEVIVFTLIIPVLVWRSFSSHHVDEENKRHEPHFAYRLRRRAGGAAAGAGHARVLGDSAELHRLASLVVLGLVLLTGVGA